MRFFHFLRSHSGPRFFPFGLILLAILMGGCGPAGGRTVPAVHSVETPSPSITIPAAHMEGSSTLPPSEAFTPSAESIAGPAEFTVRIPKADVWDAPENEGNYWNLQTQLVLGEKVLILGRAGDWAQIAAVEQPSKKDARGYPGWVRSDSLSAGWPAADQFAVVMKSFSRLRDDIDAEPSMKVYLDTRLPVQSIEGEWIQVRVPDGAAKWVPLADVRLTGDPSRPVPVGGLFKIAETLVGVPYQWGGTTTGALDCSGLPYRLFHAFGIRISRDADDQALEGEFVDRTQMRKGDLIFVSEHSGGNVTHEAIYWGSNLVMDSDAGRGTTIRPITEFFRFYFWISARRFLP
jgi:cell wall-associated NlpC family hydrolase